MVSATKRIIKMGKNNPLATIRFLESFMALTWPKRTQQHPKFMGLFSHSLATQKQVSQLGENRKNLEKHGGELLASS